MGLFSFVGGLLGGGSKKKAAKKASQAQIEFAQKGLDETARQFDLSRSDQLPWLQGGQSALAAQMDLLGLGGSAGAPGAVSAGDAQQAAIDNLRQSPLFQSLFDSGREALLQSAAATGNMRGGRTITDLADFGRDTLSGVIQSQLANLGGISAQGGATGASLGALGANAAQSMADLFNQQGAATAGKHLAIGGINAQNWGNAGAFIDDAITGVFKGLF